MARTIDDLWILWDEDSGCHIRDHKEVSGFCIYTIFPHKPDTTINWQQFIQAAWPSPHGIDIKITHMPPHNDGGRHRLVADIYVQKWPKTNDDWLAFVKSSLSSMATFGASACWIASEGISELQLSRDPEIGSGVYAAYSLQTKLLINSMLYEEIAYLSHEQIKQLIEAAVAARK